MFICIGHCCLDDIYEVLQYPKEDSTVGSRTEHNRCTRQNWARGGNASNNATVLAELGANVEFLGVLANDHLRNFFQQDMHSYGIKYDLCPILENKTSPTSVVINSLETGTRTIIHNNGNLPELSVDDFKIDLSKYTWIHFEGRNELQTVEMFKIIKKYNETYAKSDLPTETTGPNYKNRRLPLSVEVDRTRESLTPLLSLVDVVFVGKDFAMMKGAQNCTEAAQLVSKYVQKGTVIVCPWGDQGAAFCIAGENNSHVKKVDAFLTENIIDSLGAGDTFDSAVIYGLRIGLDVEASIRFGCRVASAKLGQRGFRNLGTVVQSMPEYKDPSTAFQN